MSISVDKGRRMWVAQIFCRPDTNLFLCWMDLDSVSAVEQLQAMAAKRQYKEAAGQLEVYPHVPSSG
jgi:hypothetical protein